MMTHRSRAVYFPAALAAGFCLAVAVTASAQQAPPAPAPSPATSGRAAGLDLTADQQASIRTLREQQRTEAQALREQTKAARKALQSVQQAAALDEAALRAAANGFAATQADMLVLRARHRDQFLALLTPEQRERVKQRQMAARARAGRRADIARRRGAGAGRAGRGVGPQFRMGHQPGGPGQFQLRWRPQVRPRMMGPGQPGPLPLRKHWI